jgi:uroporphyrinogen-III synthase
VTQRKPLAGKRILVTRAPHQAGRLADALEAVGATVLRLPTIEIGPPDSYGALDAAISDIENFDWLILTSANAAKALGERMAAANVSAHRFAGTQIAAIGLATAKAAAELSLGIDLIPTESVAESMASALADKVSGKRVLLVRATVARDVIPLALSRNGANVEIAAAYRTILPESSVAELTALLTGVLPDAVTFTSSSTVTNFFALLEAAGRKLPNGLKAVSIGPITTSTLKENAWEPAAEAAQANIPSLVEACVRLLSSC